MFTRHQGADLEPLEKAIAVLHRAVVKLAGKVGCGEKKGSVGGPKNENVQQKVKRLWAVVERDAAVVKDITRRWEGGAHEKNKITEVVVVEEKLLEKKNFVDNNNVAEKQREKQFVDIPWDCLEHVLDYLPTTPTIMSSLISSSPHLKPRYFAMLRWKRVIDVNSNFSGRLLSRTPSISSMSVGFSDEQYCREAERYIMKHPEQVRTLVLWENTITQSGDVTVTEHVRCLETSRKVGKNFIENRPELQAVFTHRYLEPIGGVGEGVPRRHPKLKVVLYGFNHPVKGDVVPVPSYITGLGILESSESLPDSPHIRTLACRLHILFDIIDLLPITLPNLRTLLVVRPLYDQTPVPPAASPHFTIELCHPRHLLQRCCDLEGVPYHEYSDR